MTVGAAAAAGIPFVASHADQIPATDPAVVSAVPAVDTSLPRTTLTLLTGDKVTLSADGTTSVLAGPGRRGVTFAKTQVDGHVRVVPSDAARLVSSGAVDARLFDVTALAAAGYTDAKAATPLIVGYPHNTASTSARSSVTSGGAKVTRDLTKVRALTVNTGHDDKLWPNLTQPGTGGRALRAGVAKIWLDGRRHITLDQSVLQIGAPSAWKDGYNGSGVTVAVLDTGIDATHPDLAGKITAEKNFTDETDPTDLIGHGTHIASTIAGTGAQSKGRFTGVAPGAKLLDGKVCAPDCSDSSVLAGMQWAVDQGAQVINLSLGSDDVPGVDPIEQAINDLSAERGTLFVVAAGNDGKAEGVGTPATADAALAVAAVTKKDEPVAFSNRGPRREDDAIKPDIAAPGVDIVAAKAAKGVIGTPSDVPGYTSLSGTSMATPHVAGSAAILAQRHPDWKGAQLKAALMGAAAPIAAGTVYGQGAGRVDVARAVDQQVVATPPSVSFGRARWPHTDDEKMSQVVTYHNYGTTAQTVQLAANGTGPGGAAEPAGMFTVDQPTLTVPAGGAATATLTADTRITAAEGRWTGFLEATADGVRVRTPFAVNREVESYDLAMNLVDQAGNAPVAYDILLVERTTHAYVTQKGFGPSLTLRVPKGDYGMFANITTQRAGNAVDTAMLTQPRLVLDHDTQLQVDARTAKNVAITAPRKDADVGFAEIDAHWNIGGGVTNSVISLAEDGVTLYHGRIGADVAVPDFEFVTIINYFQHTASGSSKNSPWVYNLGYPVIGHMPVGFQHVVRPAELATVRPEYARQGKGSLGVRSWILVPPVDFGVSFSNDNFTLPFRRSEYVNTAPGMRWRSTMGETNSDPEGQPNANQVKTPPRVYEAGKTYPEQWNRGVFGPQLSGPLLSGDWISRLGDTISASPFLFGDGAGRPGFSDFTSARIALYRGSTLVAEAKNNHFASFTLPAAADNYRLTATFARGGQNVLSTKVEATWTFRSGHVAGTTPQRLPLSTVRFTPALDLNNAVKKNTTVTVPVVVDHQTGSAAGVAKTVKIEVSFNDGKTWATVANTGTGDKRTVKIKNPNSAGFVSLRASVSDTKGNTETQTIIRAYQYN